MHVLRSVAFRRSSRAALAARPDPDGRRDDAAALGRVAPRERRAPAQRRHRCRIVLCVVTLVAVLLLMSTRRYARGDGPIAVDNFRWMVDVVILLGDDRRDRAEHGRQRARGHHDDGRVARAHAARVVGHDAARRGARLMIVFLGIELMSIAVYALAGINRRSERSAEGALKYFLLGAFSTAFLLYGIALVYGATGTTNLTRHRTAHRASTISATARCCWSASRCCSSASASRSRRVPFHMWAPDVYEARRRRSPPTWPRR